MPDDLVMGLRAHEECSHGRLHREAADEIERLKSGGSRPFDKRAADRLADEVAVLIRRHVIDARSPAGDALLDFRDPPQSERSDRLWLLEAERDALAAKVQAAMAEIGLLRDRVDSAREIDRLAARLATAAEMADGLYEDCHDAGIDKLGAKAIRDYLHAALAALERQVPAPVPPARYTVECLGDRHYSFGGTVAENIPTLAEAVALCRELDAGPKYGSTGITGYYVACGGRRVYPL